MVGISAETAALLVHYGFDLGGAKAEKLAGQWLTQYPGPWLRLATVEALYQGRYKAVSVGHLLEMWQRLGQPLYHFNGEFERLVCSNLPQDLRVENDAKSVPEEIYLPSDIPDVTDLDLSPPPDTEPEIPQDTEISNIVEEIPEVPAVDRTGESITGESTEVVVYQEDLAATELADSAEAAEKLTPPPTQSVPIVKHTDFHSKLTALAKSGQRKKGERRKKSGI
ncbi:MAG: hypothetical protein HC849_33965 [Oscillatoriales cyanobacterium RU_3_3]|nr:hypothetical protein [Microcoleus sp. SU_5_6]NJM64015.1 hypothetical protein [Oscillatoriales cyanobacterium RU_3_3]NJR25629.1 hypothetical protein [Richelia sp. CSU_2_1]